MTRELPDRERMPGDTVTVDHPNDGQIEATYLGERTGLVRVQYHRDGAVSTAWFPEAWVNRMARRG
jgi:hypothetical protein